MTKLLNGWEMAKKIQSDCKIYVKTFSGAMVSCVEDYVKPSLKSPQVISFYMLGRTMYPPKYVLWKSPRQ